MLVRREELAIWRSVAKCLLTIAALLSVGASTRLGEPPPASPTTDSVVIGTLAFLSVVFLHWSLWRYIVSKNSGLPPALASFLPIRDAGYRRGFAAGSIGTGYFMVLMYCTETAGFWLRSKSDGLIGFLVMGVLLIGIGTAARLRGVFLYLSSPIPNPKPAPPLAVEEAEVSAAPRQPKML